MNDEARLGRMLDIQEIRDLAHRYAVAITATDLDALPELFDPGVDNGRFGRGPEGVRAYYQNYFELNQRHAFLQVGTHQVDLIDASTATGICFTRSWTGVPNGAWMDVMVVYFDSYRRTDGRWRFVHRRETLHDIVPGAAHDDPQIAGSSARGALPRTWDYWVRWKERKRSGDLFRTS